VSKLGDWRRAKGLTQEDLGAKLGCEKPTVARYEAGTRIPERDTMRRIYVVTDGAVTPNDFYDLPDLNDLAALARITEPELNFEQAA
jgi:transcriptional regulator with XRE-family HTH domain